MTNILWMGILTSFLLFLSGMASVFETSLTTVNRYKIKANADDGDIKSKKIMKLIDKFDLVITSIVVFDNIINIMLPTISLLFFINLVNGNEALAATISTIIMTFLVIIFGEILPKIFGKFYSEMNLYRFVNVFELLVNILYPIAKVINIITNMIKKRLFPKVEDNDDLDDEIITIINESYEHGNLENNQKELITKAIQFNEKTVEIIMKPKNKVVMIDKNLSNNQIYKIIYEEKYSRIPIYDNDMDNIIGILSEREFLTYYAENKNFDLNKVIVKPYFIPDTMKISTLLNEFQQKKLQIGIVVDEYGTMQGIITLEDIIEEIVGEIWDEHDDVIKKIRKIDANKILVESDVLISNINEELDINICDEDMTIAKYIIENLKEIPYINATISHDNYIITVKKIEDNHIEKVLITKLYSYYGEENYV